MFDIKHNDNRVRYGFIKKLGLKNRGRFVTRYTLQLNVCDAHLLHNTMLMLSSQLKLNLVAINIVTKKLSAYDLVPYNVPIFPLPYLSRTHSCFSRLPVWFIRLRISSPAGRSNGAQLPFTRRNHRATALARCYRSRTEIAHFELGRARAYVLK
jgi:hypothetical protein